MAAGILRARGSSTLRRFVALRAEPLILIMI
jgi:hypothetical protein|eukprot:COSAG06_NODE_3029_length_5943_cov_1.732204_2_plen_31_part_00